MKQLLPGLRLLLACAIAGLCLCCQAVAETVSRDIPPTSLRVVADDNYPPFLFRDENGRAQGYLEDYWKLWSKKTGVPVFFKPMQWSRAQEAIQAGDADVIDTIFETQPRLHLYDFTKPYADLPVNIYTSKSIGGITDKDTLQGLQVGVMAGDACIDYLAGLGLTYLKTYSTYKNLILGASRGEVKVFCLDEQPANYYFYKLNLASEFKSAFQLYTGQFHRAVRKGDLDTLALVQHGMNLITPAEDAELRAKWFGKPVGFGGYSRPIGLVLVAIAVLSGILSLWNIMLRNRVRARTNELEHALLELREAKDVADEYRSTLVKRVAERTSELTRATLSLRLTNDELHAVLDAAPIGIILARNNLIQNCNTTMEKMFGYQPDQMIGKTMRIFYADEATYEEARLRLERDLAERGSHRDEAELFRSDGSSFWCRKLVQLISRALPDEGFAVTFEDITLEREAMSEIDRARRLAEEAASAKANFLANMSHEIRTPMNAIIGMTHLALKADPSPKLMDYLRKIDRSSKHLLNIINDILDFSKVEAGKMAIESTSFDLKSVVNDVSGLVAEDIAAKGLTFTINLPEDVPTGLTGDPLRISQILINYLNNAIKFTDAGEIAIDVRTEHQFADDITLRFSVRDTGIGLSADQQTRLFQSFQQADTSTTRKFGGTGLGLAISKSLAELMGGQVGLESEAGKGSTFWFTVPLKKRDTRMRDPEGEARHMAGHVLVVDDDEAAREVERMMLEDMGCSVRAVASGAEALAELQHGSDNGRPYDLVVLDWKMPELDGVAVATKVREIPLQKLPILLMVTAYDAQELQQSVRRLENIEILAKPLSTSVLSRTLSRLLGPGLGMPADQARRIGEAARRPEDIRGARALLVEDNELNQEVARELLKEMGLMVDVAGNGAVAIDMLKSGQYDVVLMDIQMPVLDGIEATMQIRRDPRHQSLPIIAMTASVMQSDQQRCRDAGMNDHVAKPVEPDDLLKTLLKWVKPSSAAVAAQPSLPVPPRPVEDLGPLLGIAGLDCLQGLRRAGGKLDLYLSLLRKFAATQTEAPREIHTALEAGDAELALRLAHTLKGVAGNIGAGEVMAAAATLEAGIRGGGTTADLAGPLATLEASLKSLMPAILAGTKTIADTPSGIVDERRLHAVCARLSELLAHNDAEAGEVLSDNTDLLASAFAADFLAIAESVRAFEFETALAALESALARRTS